MKNDEFNNILLMRYENDNHFSFLKIKEKERENNNNINQNRNQEKTKNKNADSDNKIKNILKTNNFVIIKNEPGYYNNIYNYLLSKKLNTDDKGKTNWKKVQYPILYDKEANKITKD